MDHSHRNSKKSVNGRVAQFSHKAHLCCTNHYNLHLRMASLSLTYRFSLVIRSWVPRGSSLLGFLCKGELNASLIQAPSILLTKNVCRTITKQMLLHYITIRTICKEIQRVYRSQLQSWSNGESMPTEISLVMYKPLKFTFGNGLSCLLPILVD